MNVVRVIIWRVWTVTVLVGDQRLAQNVQRCRYTRGVDRSEFIDELTLGDECRVKSMLEVEIENNINSTTQQYIH